MSQYDEFKIMIDDYLKNMEKQRTIAHAFMTHPIVMQRMYTCMKIAAEISK